MAYLFLQLYHFQVMLHNFFLLILVKQICKQVKKQKLILQKTNNNWPLQAGRKNLCLKYCR